MNNEFTEQWQQGETGGHVTSAATFTRKAEPNPVGGDTPAGLPFSIACHLLTLASIRNLELAQQIRYARMGNRLGDARVADLVREKELNDQSMTELQQLVRRAA